MKRIVIFILMIFAFSVRISDAQQILDDCERFFSNGRFNEAINAGLEAIKAYPKNPRGHVCLGNSYLRIGETDKAIDLIKNSIKLARSKEEQMLIYGELCFAYEIKDDHDNAFSCYNQVLSMSQRLNNKLYKAIALEKIGNLYSDKREFDKALEYLNSALKITTEDDRKAPIYNKIGIIYILKRDYQKAIGYIKQANEIRKKIGDLYGLASGENNLGEAYKGMKDYDNALRCFNEAIRISKINGNNFSEAFAYLGLASLYREKKDYDTAKKYLSMAYETGSDDMKRKVLEIKAKFYDK